MDSKKYQQLVWDYQLSQDDFEDILRGDKVMGSFNQPWAISRVIENLNYYDAMRLVSPTKLRQNWPLIKNRIFNKSIKKGYEFLLQRQALSAAR